MRARALSSLSILACIAACGGGAGSTKNGAKSASGANGTDSIADEAAKNGGIAGAGVGGSSSSATASSLQFELLDPAAPVKLDGVPLEWPARTSASQSIRGDGSTLGFLAALQYDDSKIYVAGEITDPSFKVGSDHASLILAIPGAGGALVPYEIAFYAGKPGETSGSVKFGAGSQKGRDVPGAKIVEAPAKGGYTFEATVPWTTFPEARLVRVGMRGVMRYTNGSATVATGSGDMSTTSALPALPTEPEQSLIEGLLAPKHLGDPKIDIYADIAGDAMKERISIYGHFLTVCGPGYRHGKEYFVRDLAADTLSLEARSVTGHDKSDLLLRRRFTRPDSSTRDWFEVWSFTTDEPQTAFAHEIEVASGSKRIDNALRVGEHEIDVTIDAAQGWDASSYKEPIVGDAEPILLPWGPVKEQTYKLQSGKFVKAHETPNPNAQKTMITRREAMTPTDVPTPPVHSISGSGSASNLGNELLALYKKDHGVAADAKPKTDLEVSVAEDSRPERVLLYGRDLVVLGPGFRGGASYAYLSLSQFSSDADVHELTARDLTGDGAADILVRGVRHVAQSSGPAVDVDLLLVYQIANNAITRIFSIETARELSGKRVQGLVQFIPAKSGKGFDIMSSAGRATGFTKENFPWAEQAPGSGSIEPVLLPWGTVTSARYAFNGTAYAVAP
ncbi:MAG: hypothetical protein ABI183_02245 [Polyangiaceae bacterium]